jgi:hypothetical protein
MVLACFVTITVSAQTAKRIAIISGNGPLERANPMFSLGEERVTKALEAKLDGQPGITVVAQGDIQAILDAQDKQNSDRSSPETAARLGKVLNAEMLILVNLVNANQTSHQENSPGTIKTVAVVQAEVTARLINVESSVVLAVPRSTYDGNAIATQTKAFPFPKTTGPGLPATLSDLWTKATDSLVSDLAGKLKDVISSPGSASSAPSSSPAATPKVIGIDSGSVFIDRGSVAGIKAGDRFQIVRVAATSLKNEDGSAVTRRQAICLLVIDSVSDKNASGKCSDGVPQQGDLAEPAGQGATAPPGESPDRASNLVAGETIPPLLLECEGGEPCNGAWRLHGAEGEATWFARNPTRATIKVVRWTPQDILIRRTDTTDGNSAVYSGALHGSQVSGTVVWSAPGRPGASSGKWSASVPKTVCPAQAGLSSADALQIGQNALMFQLEREALDCYMVAAKAGDAQAQTAVGLIYSRGYKDIVPQDDKEAFIWLHKAADQGVYAAQKAVADMFQLGRGTAKDEELAKFYVGKAAEQKRDWEREQDRHDRAASNMLTGFVMGAVLGAALF